MRFALFLTLLLAPFCSSAQFESCDIAYENRSCGLNMGYEGHSQDFNTNTLAFIATASELFVFIYWECDDLGEPNIGEKLDVYSLLSLEECENIIDSTPGCDFGPMGEREFVYTDLQIGQLYFISFESCEGFPCTFSGFLEMENSGENNEEFLPLSTPYFANGCSEDSFEPQQFCVDKAIHFSTDPSDYTFESQRWSVTELSSRADASTITWTNDSDLVWTGEGNDDIEFFDANPELDIVFRTPGRYAVCFEGYEASCQSFTGNYREIEILYVTRSFEGEVCIDELMTGWTPSPNFRGEEWLGAPITLDDLTTHTGYIERYEFSESCECEVYQDLEFTIYYPGEEGCNAPATDHCPVWQSNMSVQVGNASYDNFDNSIGLSEGDQVIVKVTADNLPDGGSIDWYASNDLNFDPGNAGTYLASSAINSVVNNCSLEPEILSVLYRGKEFYVDEADRNIESEILLIGTGSGFYLDDLVVRVEENCDDSCPDTCEEIAYGVDCGWNSGAASLFENATGKGSGDFIPPNSVLLIYFGAEDIDFVWTSDLVEKYGYCLYVTTSDCSRCLDAFADEGGAVEYEIATSCGTSSISYSAHRSQGVGSYMTKEGWAGRTAMDKVPPFLLTTKTVDSEVASVEFSIPCNLSTANQTVYVRGRVNSDNNSAACCTQVTPLIKFDQNCSSDLSWGPNQSAFLPEDFTITTSDCPYMLEEAVITNPATGETWTIDEVEIQSSCAQFPQADIRLETDFSAGLVGPGEYNYEIIVEGACGGVLEHGFTVTVVCDDPTIQDDQVFIDYPWLTGVIDPMDCKDATIQVFDLGNYAFVFVVEATQSILYFGDGTKYCTDGVGYSCLELYGLTTPTLEWTCKGSNTGGGGSGTALEDEYPWITDYIDLEDCLGTIIFFYDFYGSVFPYFEANGRWTLFSNTGQVYCRDSPPGFICPDVYDLAEPLYTWECGQSCLCPLVYEPVCGSDGLNYTNACEAECAGVSVAYAGDCVPAMDPPIFDDYPWVSMLVDPSDCELPSSLTVYRSGSYFYIYHQSPVAGILYNSNGEFYCQDFPNFSCVDAYGFTSDDIVDQWTCDDTGINEYIQEGGIEELLSQEHSLTNRTRQSAESTIAFNCYPNPSTGRINISLEEVYDDLQIQIVGMSGQLIAQQKISMQKEIQLDLSDIEKGIYLIELTMPNRRAIKKLILI